MKDMGREVIDTGFGMETGSSVPQPKFCVADFEKRKYLVYCTAGTDNYFSMITTLNDPEALIQDNRVKIYK